MHFSWKGHSTLRVTWLLLCPFNSSSDSPIMELYYIVLSLPLCIALFSHNILYIPVLLLLLLNKLSFITGLNIMVICNLTTSRCCSFKFTLPIVLRQQWWWKKHLPCLLVRGLCRVEVEGCKAIDRRRIGWHRRANTPTSGSHSHASGGASTNSTIHISL